MTTGYGGVPLHQRPPAEWIASPITSATMTPSHHINVPRATTDSAMV